MSKMKSMVGMYTALAMMGTGAPCRERIYESAKTDEERKRRFAKVKIERNKANGLKEFYYGENSLYALNQKNADKKARKKHWL